MKKIIFCVVSILGLCSVYAQTNVSGGIYQNTTWTLSGNPYTVTGSIVVFPGKTLNIEPGVEIKIDNQVNNNIYIEARGTINCIGTDILPIKINTIYDTTSTVGWQGFICTSSQGGVINADRFQISNAYNPFAYETALNNYQYTNCKFSHCSQAITVANSVELMNCQFIDNQVGVFGWSYFTIQNCFFKGNTTSIQAYSTAFLMTNSNFIDNQIGLTFAAFVFDSMYISDCQFLNNGLALGSPNNGKVQNCLFSDNTTSIQYASNCEIFNNEFFYNELALEVSVNADIHDNQINNNMGGLLISGVTNAQDSPQIYNNEICSNINYNVNNNTNMNYSLLSNCFCGLDSSTIEIYLIDGYDDITRGLVNYAIYDDSCSTILSYVTKVVLNEPAGLSELNATWKIWQEANAIHVFVEKETQIQIFSITGKVYLELTILPGDNSLGLDLPSGIYLLADQDGNRHKFYFD